MTKLKNSSLKTMESKEKKKHIKIAIRPMEPEEFESIEKWEKRGWAHLRLKKSTPLQIFR
jgi:hypothetical protein